MHKKTLLLILVSALALAACVPTSPASAPTPTQVPTATYPPPQDAPLLPPAAAQNAQAALAVELGLALDRVVISLVEPAEWSDSCLGLGGAAEICEAVITPGYRVQMTAEGGVYEFRTNEDGTVLRRVEEPDSRRLTEKAAGLLAELAGLPLEEIVFVGMVSVDWPDACLGAAELDEACAEMITPGYKVELDHSGRVYVLHTNAEATLGRLGGPEELVIALKVRQVAAQEGNTALVTVRLVAVEMEEWPNSCLGIEKQGTACLEVITPGYRVTVEAGGQMHEYHTNRDASAIVRTDQ